MIEYSGLDGLRDISTEKTLAWECECCRIFALQKTDASLASVMHRFWPNGKGREQDERERLCCLQ
jgi:hypothetical protein